METQKRSLEHENSIKEMEKGHSVFLDGGIGSGISTILNAFLQRTEKKFVQLAASDSAAMNTGCSSLYSFFGFCGDVTKEAGEPCFLLDAQIDLYRSCDGIIINAIESCRVDYLHAIDRILREIAEGEDRKKPFGDKQMIFAGDFSRAEPEIKDKTTYLSLKAMFGGVFAFLAPGWRDGGIRTTTMNQDYIHSNKRDSELLKRIRKGHYVEHNEVPVDRQKVKAGKCPITESHSALDEINKKTCSIDSSDLLIHKTTVLTTNETMSNSLNKLGIMSLSGPEMILPATQTGCFPDRLCPTNRQLTIKAGMRVILLTDERHANGALEHKAASAGTVTGFKEGPTLEVTVELDDGGIAKVTPKTWEHRAYDLFPDSKGKYVFEERVVGWFTQLPLIPEYSITIDRAQSLILNKVDIVLGHRYFSSYGAIYSALSCCKDLDNVSINRPLTPDDILVSPEVSRFYGWSKQA